MQPVASPHSHIFKKELPHSVMAVFSVPLLSIARDGCLKAMPPETGQGPVGKRPLRAMLCVAGRLWVNHKAGYHTEGCVSQCDAVRHLHCTLEFLNL